MRRHAMRTTSVLLLLVVAIGCGRERRNDLVSQETLRHQFTTHNFTANELKRRQTETLKHARAMAREYRKADKRLRQVKRDYALQAESEQKLLARIGQLKSRNTALAAQIKQLAEEEKKLAIAAEKAEGSLKALRSSLGSKIKENERLTAQTKLQIEKVNTLQQELTKIGAKVKSLEKKQDASVPRAELLRRLTQREAELARLRTRQQEILKELKVLRKQNGKAPSND